MISAVGSLPPPGAIRSVDTAPPEAPKEGPAQLNDTEKKAVADLRKRDREVRQHEQAHAATGGQYAGSPTFQFEHGPDGGQYAISGEVAIDIKPVAGDPKATIRKMEVVRAAALAPAKPSSQDRAVAAAADAAKLEAKAQLKAQKDEDPEASGETVERGDVGRAIAAYGEAAGEGRPAILDLVA